ncbi:MAG TPA: hypothetical protein VGF61_02425 [Candidatus Acidoferrum sp.]|jgi:hypothetical protein
MKGKIRTSIGIATLAVAIAFSAGAGAQAQERHAAVSSTSRATAYDATRETTVLGTVVSYAAESSRAPIGAHATVQTAKGIVDVHLGPASYLRSNHFSLSAGDSVRFVGVSVTANQANIFLARIAQKGTQALALRSPRGFLLATTATRALPQAERAQIAQQGVPR